MRWAVNDVITLTKEAKIISRSCSTTFILYTYMYYTNTQIFKESLYLQLSNMFKSFANKTYCATEIHFKKGKLHRNLKRLAPGLKNMT